MKQGTEASSLCLQGSAARHQGDVPWDQGSLCTYTPLPDNPVPCTCTTPLQAAGLVSPHRRGSRRHGLPPCNQQNQQPATVVRPVSDPAIGPKLGADMRPIRLSASHMYISLCTPLVFAAAPAALPRFLPYSSPKLVPCIAVCPRPIGLTPVRWSFLLPALPDLLFPCPITI